MGEAPGRFGGTRGRTPTSQNLTIGAVAYDGLAGQELHRESLLIERIYDGVESEKGLSAALSAVAGYLRTDKAHILVFDALGNRVVATSVGCSDDSEYSGYEAYWRDRDPRVVISMANRSRIFSEVELIGPDAFERSAGSGAKPWLDGSLYSLFGTCARANGCLLGQAFLRTREQEAFGREEMDVLTRVMPHLCRSLELMLLVKEARDRAADLQAALNVLGPPLLLVDGDGRVVCMNRGAEDKLRAGDGVRLSHNRLSSGRPAVAEAILAAVSQAASFAEGSHRRKTRDLPPPAVEVPRAEHQPMGLVFMPLRPANHLRARAARARVMVVFHDPEDRILLEPVTVAAIHGLTPTEAQAAVAIASGKTLAEFSEARGCSEETARTHLKRVLEKTGARRQAQLVHLLVGSAALHRLG